MGSFAKFIIGITLGLINTAINVWIAGYIFLWILTPNYGVVAPTNSQLFVFFMLWSAMKTSYSKDHEDSSWNDVLRRSIITIVATLMAFGMAALVAAMLL